MGIAVKELDQFLRVVTKRYINKPSIVDRKGHEAVRFTQQAPEDAILLKFARLLSLCNALLLLCDNGFIQEQAIIQRAIEETNEDIMFYSINISGSGHSEKFDTNLVEFWKEDYEDPADPIGKKISRAFSRRGISGFLNRVFKQPDPSFADQLRNAISSMYSGFVHGSSPTIMEIYDYEGRNFLTHGVSGTNRHLDYIFDAKNSIYRSIISAGALAKAFGSQDLLDRALQIEREFEEKIGSHNLKMQP